MLTQVSSSLLPPSNLSSCPSPAALHPHPPLFRGSVAAGLWRVGELPVGPSQGGRGWVSSRLRCRGSQPTGGNARLRTLGSLRSLGTRGPGTDHTHNIPGSRGSGVIRLLFLRNSKCVRGIIARAIKKRLNIFMLKLKEPV